MHLRSLFALSCLLLPGAIAACGQGPSSDAAVAVSGFTSDGGADGDAGGVEVPRYGDPDIALAPKMRWSIDGAAVTEGLEPKLTIAGDERRFVLQGQTPALGGKPVVYVEFGRGAAFVAPGTYTCAALEAVVLTIDDAPDGDGGKAPQKRMTAVKNGPSRPCTVTIDQATELVDTPAFQAIHPKPRSWKRVLGHVEATVGSRDDAASPTASVRIAFAGTFVEH